jgi:hypothetical protein
MRRSDQRRGGGEQVRVQARLRLVQHQQLGRARGEQRRGPQQVAQRAVGQLRRRQRAQQALLVELQREPTVLGHRHREPRPREGVVDGRVQGVGVPDLADRLQRRREVGAVVVEHRGAGAHPGLARRGVGVGAEVVVEPPRADALPQQQHLGRDPRVGERGEHAVGGGDAVRLPAPGAALVARAHHRPRPVGEQGGLPEHRAAPHALPLELGVAVEHRVGGDGHAEVEGVAELVAREAEPQPDR